MGSSGGNSNDGIGHIGSPTLPASRPLCIPVRFQPLGSMSSGARWMEGTGALAAAASTLPLPLDDSGSSGGDDNYNLSMGARHETDGICAADIDVAAGSPVVSSCADAALTAASAPTARPWVWAVVGALLLVLVLCGGGAAWLAWQKRQRARSAGDALATGDARANVAVPSVAGASSGFAPTVAPMSPLPQAPAYLVQDGPLTAQPLSMPLDPAVQTGTALPAPWPHAAAMAGHWTQPLPQPATPGFARSPAQKQQQHQDRDQTIATVARQGQARGAYVMVERPPLRMRNVTALSRRTAAYSDDDDDYDVDDDGGNNNVDEGESHTNSRHNARRVLTQSKGASHSDSWTRRAPPPRQMTASPQESHYDEDAMARSRLLRRSTWTRGADDDVRPQGRGMDSNGAGGDTMQLRQHLRPARPSDDNGDDDNDSLIDGVADYWADAERARQTYFASPQERAAHAMSLGPRAYSPDGTPMPLRG